MSIDLLVQALLNGFGLAMVYVLVALGLTLIFSILEIINFAHGEFYMLGGYVTYYGYALFGLNYIHGISPKFHWDPVKRYDIVRDFTQWTLDD